VEFMSNTFRLKAETVEPDYSADIDSDSGFLPCSAIINAGSKELSITLPTETFFDCIDTEYQRHSFIWDVSGFTSLTFDYEVVLNSTYFVLELVDENGTVKWSKNGTASGTGQMISMTATKLEFRVRCKADYTSPVGPWTQYAKVSNIEITRYPTAGYIEQPWRMGKEHIDHLEQLDLSWTAGTEETASIEVLEFIQNYLRLLALGKTWSESVVGIVMSGYVRDQDNAIITNGVKIVLESTWVFGKDTMGAVNPDTGFYQIFVKDAKYDKRHLILQVSGKTTNLSLSEYGSPEILDATTGEVPNQDLHFWKAPLCKSVAHVDSLVTY